MSDQGTQSDLLMAVINRAVTYMAEVAGESRRMPRHVPPRRAWRGIKAKLRPHWDFLGHANIVSIVRLWLLC
jgi:hypothetical protein